MLLKLQNISKSYGNPSDSTHQEVLKNLSLDVSEGETLAILGPSGSGKSTLLHMIGTLDYPDTGSIVFKDQLITDLTAKELDHFRNKEIGFVFQNHHLLPQCNVLENVLIPTLLDTSSSKEKNEKAEAMLNSVGLWEHRHKKPGMLSGGECQRVAVLRAMINSPSVILADEPTGALDSKNVTSISEMLLKMNKEENVVLILITHSMPLASEMDTIYELNDGQLQRK